MKVILAISPNHLAITFPAPPTMAALTSGGFGRLPGDAVTDDIAESEARRVEAATSMPLPRAIENMIRAGHEADFARHWCGAVINGGETSRTALEMVRRHTYPAGGEHHALDRSLVPTDRMFRDAWRAREDKIFVDLKAAKTIFSQRIIKAKRRALDGLSDDIDTKRLSGDASDDLEAQYDRLVAIDLRQLGAKLMAATSVDALAGLWPADLRWN